MIWFDDNISWLTDCLKGFFEKEIQLIFSLSRALNQQNMKTKNAFADSSQIFLWFITPSQTSDLPDAKYRRYYLVKGTICTFASNTNLDVLDFPHWKNFQMVAGQQWQYAHLQFYVRKNAVSPKIEGSFSSTNVVVIWATGPATYAKTDATKLGSS